MLKGWSGLAMGVAVAMWIVAAWLVLVLVDRVGWLGIALVGAAILLVALRVEMDEENALPGRGATPRPTGVSRTGTSAHGAREEAGRAARRSDRERLLYVARTIGIALFAVGLFMWARHQVAPGALAAPPGPARPEAVRLAGPGRAPDTARTRRQRVVAER